MEYPEKQQSKGCNPASDPSPQINTTEQGDPIPACTEDAQTDTETDPTYYNNLLDLAATFDAKRLDEQLDKPLQGASPTAASQMPDLNTGNQVTSYNSGNPLDSHDLDQPDSPASGNKLPDTSLSEMQLASLLYTMVESFLDLDLMGQMHEQPRFVSCLNVLTSRGLDVNTLDEKHMASRKMVLHMVSANGIEMHSDIVRPLLTVGALANSRDTRGDSPLHTAVARGCDQIGKTLIEGGADTRGRNMAGQTALHLAARREYSTSGQ